MWFHPLRAPQLSFTICAQIAAFVCALMMGCNISMAQETDASKPLRIVSFGTSLTNRGGWQVPLQTSLSACMNRPVEVLTVAQSGATSDWAVSHLDDVIQLKPDVVLIEFYANDAAVNRLVTRTRSRTNIELVFDRLKTELPQTRVIMTRMNPMAGMRGSMRPLLEWYIDMQRNEALKRSFEYVDYYVGWSTLTEKELEAAIPDGLHPHPDIAARIITSIMTPYLCNGNG